MIKATVNTLGKLFRYPVCYHVPQFQRPYIWNEENQWKPLWEDIKHSTEKWIAADDKDQCKPHFLGSIVLQERRSQQAADNIKKFIVVDGQQRLTTMQLAIQAAVQVLQDAEQHDEVKSLKELLLNSRHHLRTDQDNPTKIRQSNRNDQTAFLQAITGYPDLNDSRPIIKALRYFEDSISEWVTQPHQDLTQITQALTKIFDSQITIALIELEPDDEPHTIFGALNGRATPLQHSDLIKNTVMYKANVIDDEEEAKAIWPYEDPYWAQSTNEGNLTRQNIDRFLHYWLMVQKKASFTANRTAAEFTYWLDANPSTDIRTISHSIEQASEVFKNLDQSKLSPIEDSLTIINTMGIGMAKPFLLWLYTSDTPETDRINLVRMVESSLVRRMLCKRGASGHAKFFLELVAKLDSVEPEERINEANAALAGVRGKQGFTPSNTQLTQYLLNNPLPSTSKIQTMFFLALERAMRGTLSEPLVQNANYSIEHIMPEKWHEHWEPPKIERGNDRIAVEDKRKQAIQNIGNLTLITINLNSKLSNSGWQGKREFLQKHSTLLLNKQILDHHPANWDEKAITERATTLATIINDIWLPPMNSELSPRPKVNTKPLPQKAYHSAIIELLTQQDGIASLSSVNEHVFKTMNSQMTHADHQITHKGIPRWKENVQHAHVTLVKKGIIKSPVKRRQWELHKPPGSTYANQ